MNADRLLAHYERIDDAPDAIARLRRFILGLAVRGKLVPQDPNDEPASELLERIAAEKARLVKAGEFREPRNAVEIKRDKLPFVPAVHWEWSRLIDIACPSYGFAFQSSEFNTDKRGMPLIRIRDISKTDTEVYYEGDFDSTCLVRAGDYLVGMDGNFNLRRWQGLDGLLNQRVMRINGWRCDVDQEFVKLPLQMVLDYLHGATSLTTVKHLSAKQVNGIEIPLPPLAEQHRIVTKVDELMALCDRLEAARTEREATRDRMATASLVRLNDPDPVVFRNHAAFAIENLTPLTIRTDQIKALRQTILNLAVRGKLVPQDPNDEPAFCLIERARFSMSRLIQCGEAAKMKSMPPIMEEDELFPVPKTWEWVRLGELSRLITKGSSPKWQGIDYVDKASGVLFVTSENVGNYKLKKLDKLKYVETRFNEIEPRSVLQKGDILLNLVGASIGRSAEFDLDCVANINQAVALIRPIQNDEDAVSAYLLHYLNSPVSIREMLGSRVINAQPNISLTDIRIFLVPLPPPAEQHRIVAKVDELMALCDRLEKKLAGGDDTRRRLLDALLHEVLVMGADRKSVA